MPQTVQIKDQFGLNWQALRVKDGTMSMIQGSLHSPIRDKCVKCSLALLPQGGCNYRLTC